MVRLLVLSLGLLLSACGRIGFEENPLSSTANAGAAGRQALNPDVPGGMPGTAGTSGQGNSTGGPAAGWGGAYPSGSAGSGADPEGGTAGAGANAGEAGNGANGSSAGLAGNAGSGGSGGGNAGSGGSGGGNAGSGGSGDGNAGSGGSGGGNAGSGGSGGDAGIAGTGTAGDRSSEGGAPGGAGTPANGGDTTDASGGSSSAGTGGGSSGAAGSAAGSESHGGAAGAADEPRLPHCLQIPPLDQAPAIDGALEPGMALEPVIPVGWRHPDTPLPPGHEMHYAVGWRPSGLYFYLEVTDPDRNPAPVGSRVWMGDSVEIYVDHDAVYATPPPYYDDVGTRQFLVQAPATEDAPGNRAEIRFPIGYYFLWEASHWLSVPTLSGYIVEAFVDAASLALPSWTLVAGQHIGFDLAHNVSVPPNEPGVDGNRLSQYFLQIREPPDGTTFDYPFDNESVFCSPTLVAP